VPIVPLRLIPGVNADFTPTLNQAGVSSCDLIRWKDKLPQKLGGWDRFYPYNLSGVPRDIHGWADLNAVDHLAVGTTTSLVVVTNGSLQDITPQTLISDFPPDFTTTSADDTVTVDDPNILNVTTYDSVFFNTPVSVGGLILQGVYPIDAIGGATSYNIIAAADATASESSAGAVPIFTPASGSSIVSVALPDHALSVGDTFDFPIPTVVGGTITIEGVYRVIGVPNTDNFTISGSAEAANSTPVSMNGGEAQLVYYITLGPAAAGTGYGVGGYGVGGYGTGVVPASQTGTPITAVDWMLDNWGEILLANPKGGGIYYWQPNSGFQTAQLVSTGPVFNNGIFVSMPAQILVAWGSTSIGQQQDPLMVRWSDSQDFLNWAETAQTQAGSYRIPTGSMIVGGIQGPQQGLIWTDLDVYAMQYISVPGVFGFNKLSSGCGLIGPHAVTSMRGNVYWLNGGSVFVLSGNGVQQIPCSVWDVIFQDLDTSNQQKIVAAANSQFDEIAFYYPSLSGGTGENDKYIKLNVSEGSWDYGNLARSTWMDQSVLGQAIGTSPAGLIFQHETSPDADGQPLVSSFTTGYFVLTEGQDLAFVDWFFPDMKWGLYAGTQGATVNVTINTVAYPNGDIETFGPYPVTQAVDFVNTRLRNRQLSLTFQSNDLGSFWRLGQMRIRVSKAGRR